MIKKIVVFVILLFCALNAYGSSVDELFAVTKVKVDKIIVKIEKLNENKTDYEKYIYYNDLYERVDSKVSKTRNKLQNKYDETQNPALLNKIDLFDMTFSYLLTEIDKKSEHYYMQSNITANSDFDDYNDYNEDIEDIEKKSLQDEINKWKQTFSDSDKETVETAIADIQHNMYEIFSDKILKKIIDLNTISTQEKWNLNLNMNIEEPSLWSINSSLSLNNYTFKEGWFDSYLDVNMSWSLDANISWEKLDMDIAFLLNYVFKDWIDYFKIDNLKTSWIDDKKEINEMIGILKKFEKIWKHVRIKTKDVQKVIKVLKSIKSNKLSANIEKSIRNPFLKTYKKVGNRYYLLPTKHFCDTIASMNSYGRSFNWVSNCTNQEYDELLENVLNQDVNMFVEILSNGWVLFGLEKEDNNVSINLNIQRNQNEISSINLEVFPKEKKYVWQWIKFNYTKNKSMNFWVYVEENWNIAKIDLKSDLNVYNRFIKIDWIISIWETDNETWKLNETIWWKISLVDHKIDWNLVIKNKRYDYEQDKYIVSKQITSKISGKTDTKNKLSDIAINMQWTDIQTEKEHLSLTINWTTDSFDFDMIVTELSNSFKLTMGYNKLNDKIIKWDFSLNISTLFAKFISELSLINKNITWETKLVVANNNILNVITTWKYFDNYVKIAHEITVNVPKYALKNLQTDKISWYISLIKDYQTKNKSIDFSMNVSTDKAPKLINFSLRKEFEKEDNININIEKPLESELVAVIIGESMQPTLQNWDVTLLNEVNTYKRWDIVTFIPPTNFGDSLYIKRIIWLPWETIKLKDWNVMVCKWDNCEVLNEKYVKSGDTTEAVCEKSDFELPIDWYLMLWDNRNNSTDSRCCFGYSCNYDDNYSVPQYNIEWVVVKKVE